MQICKWTDRQTDVDRYTARDRVPRRGVVIVATPGHTGKSKVFPYSLPSVGSGADPGVQAVSPQVT